MEATKIDYYGDDVQVSFDDGTDAYFQPYRHGWGYQVEGLRCFYLIRDNKKIVQYDARLHYSGPQEDEHKLVLNVERLSNQQIAEYWRKAKEFAFVQYRPNKWDSDEGMNEKHWYAWIVTHKGWIDLENLEKI